MMTSGGKHPRAVPIDRGWAWVIVFGNDIKVLI